MTSAQSETDRMVPNEESMARLIIDADGHLMENNDSVACMSEIRPALIGGHRGTGRSFHWGLL